MSNAAITWAYQQTAPSGIAKAVLVAIADTANDAGWAWRDFETFVEMTQFSKRAVSRALRDLEEAGLVERHRRGWSDPARPGRRRKLSNAYRLCLPDHAVKIRGGDDGRPFGLLSDGGDMPAAPNPPPAPQAAESPAPQAAESPASQATESPASQASKSASRSPVSPELDACEAGSYKEDPSVDPPESSSSGSLGSARGPGSRGGRPGQVGSGASDDDDGGGRSGKGDGGGSLSPDAETLARWFVDQRTLHWPSEPGFPAPLLTLGAQAAAWLAAGLTAVEIRAVVGDRMDRAASAGKAAAHSFEGFRLSLQDALAAKRRGCGPVAAGAGGPPGPGGWGKGQPPEYLAAIEAWVRDGRQGAAPRVEDYRAGGVGERDGKGVGE